MQGIVRILVKIIIFVGYSSSEQQTTTRYMAKKSGLQSMKQERREYHDRVINFFNEQGEAPDFVNAYPKIRR